MKSKNGVMVRVFCVGRNPFLLFKVILRTSIKDLGHGSTLYFRRGAENCIIE